MRLLICDDHAIFRAGLRTVLPNLGREIELEEVANARAALERVEAGGIDLVLLDLHMPGLDGWQALRRLRSAHPTVAIVIVSASEDPGDVRRALDDGASGFIPKTSDADLLRAALEVVLSGGVYVPSQILAAPETGAVDDEREGRRARARQLTARQREVLVLMSRGLSNREIGETLGIAAGTVKTHVATLLEILDVSNRTEATLVMGELDLE